MSYLHPSGYIDAVGDCSMRRVKTDPSRESGGVTLEECLLKYNDQFRLPVRNIEGYIQQLQSSWDRLSSEEIGMIRENIKKNVPELFVEKFGNVGGGVECVVDVRNFIEKYILLSPREHTIELLNELYSGNKSYMSRREHEGILDGISDWHNNQPLSYSCTSKVILLILFFCVIFVLIGGVIGWGVGV